MYKILFMVVVKVSTGAGLTKDNDLIKKGNRTTLHLYFYRSLDGIKIYSRVLTETEVMDAYTAEK